MIPRPSPHGHVLAGGTYQENDWNLSVDYDIAKAIWARCLELAPTLQNAETKVISHNVGLRPARRGGPRIEAEQYNLPLRSEFTVATDEQRASDLLVVHAYGFG